MPNQKLPSNEIILFGQNYESHSSLIFLLHPLTEHIPSGGIFPVDMVVVYNKERQLISYRKWLPKLGDT